MSRIAFLLAAALTAAGIIACGGGDDDATTSASPTATASVSPAATTPIVVIQTGTGSPSVTPAPGEWIHYISLGSCIQFDYPGDWSNTPSSAILFGTDVCPGGKDSNSEVVTCDANAVNEAFDVINLRGPAGDEVSVEWYLSDRRCESLADHFEQMRTNLAARNVTPAVDATIGAYPARCSDMTFDGQAGEIISQVCAFEVLGSVYHIFLDADATRRDEFKPTLDRIAASISIAGVGGLFSPTASPAN